MTPKKNENKNENKNTQQTYRTMSFRKARLMREAEASKCLKDVVENCVCNSCWMNGEEE